MKLVPQGFRVAVVGVSSLLGKEVLDVLEEHNFPISRLVSFEGGEEPDLPIVDLRENLQATVADQDVFEQDLDFAFLTARPGSTSSLPSFLNPTPSDGTRRGHCAVIDLTEMLPDLREKVLSVPFLETAGTQGRSEGPEPKFFTCPLSSAILISSLMLRLAAQFQIGRAVAQIFEPVSAIGARAIEELQKQTVNLLSFQKIPRSVFGAQLAFNLLPRWGKGSGEALAGLEERLRRQLREYLAGRALVPALRLLQTPVFYSLGVSLYVETARQESPEAIAHALGGKPIHIRRSSQPAPTQAEAAGSSDMLVDAITPDPDHPAGVWIWAVADNMRLAAVNAVEIAERILRQVRPPHRVR